MIRRSRSSLRLSLFAAPVAMACAVNFLGDLGTSQSVVGNVFRVEAFPSVSGLEAGDEFGASGTSLGDLDGDGVEDWLIGAPEDDDGGEDRGAIYFLFMRADGTLRTQWKISDTFGGFGGYLQDRARFGFSVANLGDLDADGVTEVAVGAPGMKEVWILFLRPNATFKNVVSIADTPPSFAFGFSLAVMGDLDGDGIQELACGDPLYRCSVGGCPYPYDGATFVYFLNPDGTTRAIQTITHASAGFQDTLSPYDYFGGALSCTSDLDSDGLRELVVSAPGRSCGTGRWVSR